MPCFMRWPGKIKAGSVLNGIVSHIDMFPTLLAAAGNPDVTQQLLNGCTVDGKTVQRPSRRLQQVPYLTGEVKESPRNAIMYFSDDGDVIAVRVGDWKFHLAVQRANTMRQWAEPFVKLRLPYIMSLRRDPFERAEFNSNTYLDWMVDHVPQMYLMQAVVAAADRGLREVPAAAETRLVQSGCGAGAGDAPRLSRGISEPEAKGARAVRAPLRPAHARILPACGRLSRVRLIRAGWKLQRHERRSSSGGRRRPLPAR